MPSKKKKYNARFPATRIKKIMQSDEEIGKVASAVPVIISRTLELFVESLLTKTLRITHSRNAKTLSTSHMKQCIMSEQRFDFLKELVKNIPDISVAEEACNYNDDSSPEEQYPDSDTPYDLSLPSTSMQRAVPNGATTFARSVSLNGAAGGLKRHHQQPASSPASVIVQNAAVFAQMQQEQQHQQQVGYSPAKLARSESTPARTNVHAYHSRQIRDTAIPAPISSYELNKPIVKIEYSKIPTKGLGSPEAANCSSAGAVADAAFNFAAPVINIDLTNIVAAAAETPAPTTTICYGATSASKSDDNGDGNDSNNSRGKLTATFNHISGGSSNAPFIPKATVSAPINESFFELDEDYDNI
ncbi:uncharacterized protein LOC115633625 [Scaptodrosophila lebanonensis]|uniref:Uncharacterized protein LOC115633625 n=1 Tax=Drosophila lebanonensis TaxID=7225 RepID=A0A6J2UI92_DROLE|nr:uncharacterized protein LOC115633625 [Scaptodrosophila lebanonensis]